MPEPVTTYFDAIIVGGGITGLAAATALGEGEGVTYRCSAMNANTCVPADMHGLMVAVLCRSCGAWRRRIR